MALYRYKMKLANIRYSSRLARSDFTHLPAGETFQCTTCESLFPSRDALAMHRMEAAAVGKKCSPVSAAQQRASLLHDACASLSAVQHELAVGNTDLAKQKLDANHELTRRDATPLGKEKEKQQMLNAAALQYAASIMSQWYMLWQQPAVSNGSLTANCTPNANGDSISKPNCLSPSNHCSANKIVKRELANSRTDSESSSLAANVGASECSERRTKSTGKIESNERKVYVEVPHLGAGALFFPDSNRLYCAQCDTCFSQPGSLSCFVEHDCFRGVQCAKRSQYRRLLRPTRRHPKRPKSVNAIGCFEATPTNDLLPCGESKMEFAHACRYCLIGFQNDVLYSLHSGCHNINNPLQCNRCGIVFQSMNSFAAHTLIHS